MEKTEKVLVELSIEKEQNEYMSTRAWAKVEIPGRFGTYLQIFDEAMIKELSEGFNINVQLTGKPKKIIIP